MNKYRNKDKKVMYMWLALVFRTMSVVAPNASPCYSSIFRGFPHFLEANVNKFP